jgi:hypothetical protein
MMAFILKCYGGFPVLLILPPRTMDVLIARTRSTIPGVNQDQIITPLHLPETAEVVGIDPDFKGEHL